MLGKFFSKGSNTSPQTTAKSLSAEAKEFAKLSFEEHGLPFLKVEHSLEEITASPDDLSIAAKLLRERGIVTLKPRSIPTSEISQEVIRVRELVNRLKDGAAISDLNMSLRLAEPGEKYRTMADSAIPVVSVRNGVDLGMVDIFHGEKLFPALGKLVSESLREIDIEALLGEATGKNLRFSNFNLYINDSVTTTRSWHVDSYGGKQFKAFMYLTDVMGLADGPYCYVVDSPNELGFEEANKAMASAFGLKTTDVTLFKRSKAIPLIAEIGQVVISNQSGAHRGHPQSKGAFRCIAALNFTER